MVALMIIITGFLYAFKLLEYIAIPLFITFLILKLISVISWSWWLVCLPLLAMPVLIILDFVLVALMQLCTENV